MLRVYVILKPSLLQSTSYNLMALSIASTYTALHFAFRGERNFADSLELAWTPHSNRVYLYERLRASKKVKLNVIQLIRRPLCEGNTAEALRYGTHCGGISQFYLHAPTRFIYQWNVLYLPLPSQPKLILIYRSQKDGRLSWSRHHRDE